MGGGFDPGHDSRKRKGRANVPISPMHVSEQKESGDGAPHHLQAPDVLGSWLLPTPTPQLVIFHLLGHAGLF